MRLARWVSAGLERRAAILLYHRVAELDVDPWGLAVAPAHIAEHLEVVARCAAVLTLPELVSRLTNHTLPRRAIVITFDDGYADNLVEAKPALERAGMPATIFITTGAIDAVREFWWDQLEAILLTEGPLPESLHLDVDGQARRWSLDGAASYTAEHSRAHRHWRAWEPPPTPRHALFVELWRLLQMLHDEPRRALLDRLAAWAGRGRAMRASRTTLSRGELVELTRGGLIAAGAHTMTHSRLSALSEPEQRAELVGSRERLQEILGVPVTTMSYPFGGPEDYTPATVAIAREAGFACACATTAGTARSPATLFELPRFFVPDVDGQRFEEMLDRWLRAT